ncbi:hypothetical protein QQF64_002997 [Cirrhinus molitorella]|uniref:Uncharacterized protein n=1 Tax=Cirrhinus molitorella TaxID=172907 RepID=A0ABR3MJV8_9TELE
MIVRLAARAKEEQRCEESSVRTWSSEPREAGALPMDYPKRTTLKKEREEKSCAENLTNSSQLVLCCLIRSPVSRSHLRNPLPTPVWDVLPAHCEEFSGLWSEKHFSI